MNTKSQTLVHLHNHFYSHDSFGEFSQTVLTVKQLGFNAIAMTEHGTLKGVINFINNCEANDIKPIVGIEIYLGIDDQKYHLTLLAKNQTGYENLVKLNNLAKIRGSTGSKKRNEQYNTVDEVLEHHEGIIVLTGCPASPFQIFDEIEAENLLLRFKLVFKEDLYAEAQILFNLDHYNRAKLLADKLDLQMVITNDCHFPLKEHAEFHQIYLKLVQNHVYNSSMNYIATEEELIERTRLIDSSIDIRPLIENTRKIADSCSVIKIKKPAKLPHIKNANAKLIDLANSGYKHLIDNKVIPDNEDYSSRFARELDVIIKSDYAGYFLIVKDLIDAARAEKIEIGVGRGSSAGSLVSMCLGITGVDPIKYNLMFERFLNPERIELPDIDTDISSIGRQTVIKYANEKYHSLQIAAYDTWGIKSGLQKFGSYFLIDEDLKERVSDEDNFKGPAYLEMASKFPEFDKFLKLINNQVKGISRHAGGIVIIDDNDIPFELSPDNDLIVAFSEGVNSKDLATAGGVKFDMLGLKALDILQELKQKLNVVPDEPVDGSDVFELFREGRTTGIFQFTGTGNINFTKKIKPNNIEDLIAINALYRKGTLVSGTADHFLEARHGKIRKLHPEIDEILAATYGCLVYQEDIMKLYAWACDKTFGQADFARKALVKYEAGVPAKEKMLLELKQQMYEGMNNKGLAIEVQNELWNEMVAHSLYSFNRSHSVAYALIAWEMAWFKKNYPMEFFASVLNHRPDEEKQDFIFEILAEGGVLEPPDVNLSTDNAYTTDGEKLYLPLSSIHGLGPAAAEHIVKERENGLYLGYEDFVKRTKRRPVTKGVLKILYEVGAFNKFADDEKILSITEYNKLSHKEIQKKYFIKQQIPDKITLTKLQQAWKHPKGVGGFVVDKEKYYTKKGKEKYRYYLAPNGRVNSDQDVLEVGECFRALKTEWNTLILDREFQKL